ncbi:hypothetical protein HRG_014790 [Hirsutella rhossiliensis]
MEDQRRPSRAVSASGKGQRAPREIRSLPTAETAGPSPPQTRSSDAPRDIRPQPTWRAAGPSLPSNGIGLATASAGSKGPAGYLAPADMEGRRAFAAVERD